MVWKNVPKKTTGPGHWPESKKLEVLQAYLIMGNLRLAASTCNVPEITARTWKVSQWWTDTEAELRRGGKVELSSKLANLVNKAMKVLEDRIENGNYVYNVKLDKTVRVPITAEHANKIITQQIDRQLSIEKTVVEKATDEGLEARLAKIRQEMIQIALKNLNPKDVIDVSPIKSENPPDGVSTELGSSGKGEGSPQADSSESSHDLRSPSGTNGPGYSDAAVTFSATASTQPPREPDSTSAG